MARATGANAKLAAKFESTYGTPPGGNYALLPIVSWDLGEEQGLLANDVLGTGREPLAPDLDVANNTGSPVVPVDVRNFGTWLKLFLGAPVSVGVLAAAGAINFSAQPANNSTVTINGDVWTFKTSGATGNQVNIGVDLPATMTALAAALNASSDVQVTPATYTGAAAALTILYDTLGVAGNAFTLAASGTSNGVPTGATLTGGANSHTFTSGAVSLPSLSAEIGNPEVPSFGMSFGIRGNTLKVALARSGKLNATLGLIAQGETIAGATAAGTPTELVMQRFSQFLGQVKRNGVQLGSVVQADFTLSNDLDTVEVIRPDGRIEDADPGTVGFTGAIVTRFKDTVLLDQATSQTPCAISFGWSIDATKSLLVTVPTTYLPKAKRPVTGPKGIQTTFNYQAAKDPVTGHTFTIVLTNDVAGY